jgi:hypothetical protein
VGVKTRPYGHGLCSISYLMLLQDVATYWPYLIECGLKTMLLPLFIIWFVITYLYSKVWELLMNYCNRWCVKLNHYNLCLFSVWFEIPRDFLDYQSYMGSSLRIWSLRRLFLDLCSYNLDGFVKAGIRARFNIIHVICVFKQKLLWKVLILI